MIGYNGDNQPATSAFLQSFLVGLAVDSHQNVYVSDWLNQRVRQISAISGIITTVAGTGTANYSGDGHPATAATVNEPAGLAFDANDNLYIADYGNCVVRRISATDGTISTVAGTGTCGNAGDGQQATAAGLAHPWAITLDGNGAMYISTTGNTIRKVSGGIITTIAGNGTAGYSGDGGLATSAQLNSPQGLAADSAGNVYFSDLANGSVRVLLPQTTPVLTVSSSHSDPFTVGQNGVFVISVGNAPAAAATTGTVTVAAILPATVNPVSMGGSGWSCAYTAPAYTCQNTGVLTGGSSFGALDLTVSVLPAAPPQVTIQVAVSGGGATATATQDLAFIAATTPVLSISASHYGNFVIGTQAPFTINVGNQPSAPSTTSPVSVTDTLPSG